LALETSGVDFNRAVGIFYNLTGSNTNPTLQAIDEVCAYFQDTMIKFMNSNLQSFKTINLATLKEDKKLTQYYLQQFGWLQTIYQRIK
jgi:peptidyl-dipeptidase Dcp